MEKNYNNNLPNEDDLQTIPDEDVTKLDPNREYNPEEEEEFLRDPNRLADPDRQLPEMDPNRI